MERYRHCKRCGNLKTPPRDRMTSLCLDCDAATSCRHDNHEGGLRSHEWRCAAGVHWFALVQPEYGCGLRSPCRWMQDGTPVKCDEFEPTPIEECVAFDRAIEESDRRMKLVLPVVGQIKRDHKGKSWTGKVPCPTGCGGILALSHAALNGHVWGRCSTDGCVCWME